MQINPPKHVIITGGHEVGGLASFAEGLQIGFSTLGIRADIVTPSSVFTMYRALRDPNILKILSTTAVFAAPLARRAICMAHGVPRVDAQGWTRLSALIGSFKLANACAGAQVVSVSHYTASTLRAIFAIQSDAVIHNPLKPLYLERLPQDQAAREYITYAGRLDIAKNVHRMLPAVKDLLDQTPGLRAVIIGDGRERKRLEAMVSGDSRFEFRRGVDDFWVRDCLRKTRIFVSGNEVEGFGIAYLEAMTQGCIVAMPGSGGGIEIHPDQVGRSVRLLPLSWNRDEMVAVFKEALMETWSPVSTVRYTPEAVARAYLNVDANFTPDGWNKRVQE